jgi:aminocarboxymuconate-semialdehyde decarboxylase
LKKQVPQKPSAYLRSLYFNTIVHSVSALDYIVKVVGADRVVIRTGYPMAMGDFDPIGKTDALTLPDIDRKRVLGGNAQQVLKL